MTTPGKARVDVRQVLAERCLTVANVDDSSDVASRIRADLGGLVVSARKPLGPLDELRRRRPELVLAVDSRAHRQQCATPEQPFELPLDDLFGEASLTRVLDDQLGAGASVAVTPTFYILPEDGDSLRAAVAWANKLDRQDTLLLMPCHWTWLRPEHVQQLIAVLKRSRHPIGLSLGNTADPLENKNIPQGLRRVVDEVPDLVLWRTDLAAIDSLACGSLAGAIGIVPSLRHAEEPGKNGAAINRKDVTPKVMVPPLLRFVRASHLQNWFASVPPWTCSCAVCQDRAVDRFSGSKEDRREASQHNLDCLTYLHEQLVATVREARPNWWRMQLQEAQSQHQALSNHIGQKRPLPPVLKAWLDGS